MKTSKESAAQEVSLSSPNKDVYDILGISDEHDKKLVDRVLLYTSKTPIIQTVYIPYKEEVPYVPYSPQWFTSSFKQGTVL